MRYFRLLFSLLAFGSVYAASPTIEQKTPVVTGGASTFDQLGSGTNITATMNVGTGSALQATGSGILLSTAFVTTPAQCSGVQFATGITASGAANCGTPAGSGNVSTSGSITTGYLPTWASATTINAVQIGSNALVGNSGGGIAALTPAQAIGVLNSGSCNAQTGASYTLVLGDANTCVTMNNAGANTLTIPTNASVAFSIGTIITIQELGVGITTVQGGGTPTIESPVYGASTSQAYSLGGAYGNLQLQKVATDTWNVVSYAPGSTKFTVGGTCSAPTTAGGNSGGTITLPGSGTVSSCTLIVTPGGSLTAKNLWVGTMADRTQLTVPAWHESASSTSTITFTIPAATAASDVLTFSIQAQ